MKRICHSKTVSTEFRLQLPNGTQLILVDYFYLFFLSNELLCLCSLTRPVSLKMFPTNIARVVISSNKVNVIGRTQINIPVVASQQ